MSKRYQVFISSTYTDMIEERQAAVEAVLAAKHIPAGMELFSAGSDPQWEIIKQWIDESDIYMLILGGRYGSIENKSGLSYTELEYDYAVKQGKPLFAVVISDKALAEKVKKNKKKKKSEQLVVEESLNPEKYTAFKEKVHNKMIRSFDNNAELKLAIILAIGDMPNKHKDVLVGWVYAKDVPEPSETVKMSIEMARLSAENASLKQQLSMVNDEERMNKEMERLWKELSTINVKKGSFTKPNSGSRLEKMISRVHGCITLADFLKEFKDEFCATISSHLDAANEYLVHSVGLQLSKLLLGEIEPIEINNRKYRLFKLTDKGRNLIAYIERKERENALHPTGK